MAKRRRLAILLIVPTLLLAIGILFLFSRDRLRGSKPYDLIVSDARNIVAESILIENRRAPESIGSVIELDDVLATLEPWRREETERRIENGEILFFPPTIPVGDNAIVCIAIWNDLLFTVSGWGEVRSYKRTIR